MTQQHLSSQDLRSANGRNAKIATMGNFVALISIGFLAVVGALIVQDLMSDVITIEPIEVPKVLSDKGYTPGVAGSRLRDALNTYAGAPPPGDDGTSLNSNLDPIAYDDAGLPSNLDLNIAARNELPDFVVPQIGLSLRTIASTIRSALRRNGYAISGELTLQDSKYALRVRIDGQQVFSTNYEAENPDDLMAKAAPKIMEVIRPSVHAMVRYRFRNEEGLRKADEIIAGYDESNVNVMWAYLLRGSHALKHGNYNEAEKMFSKARSLNSNSEHPYIQLGALLLRQAKPEDAIKQFERVVAINPKSARAHNNIGIALAAVANQDKAGLDVAKLDVAIEQYQRAIAAQPGYALPYNNLGLALFHRSRINDAIDKYRSAIEIAPKYLLARWNLAFALQGQRSFDAAETEYRAAIELATDTKQLAMLRTSLGDVLWGRAGGNGNLEATILEYQRAIAIVHPDCYSWAHYNLGLIWRGQGKINNAIAEFDKATTCDPKDETFKDNLKQSLRSQEAGAVTTGQAKR